MLRAQRNLSTDRFFHADVDKVLTQQPPNTTALIVNDSVVSTTLEDTTKKQGSPSTYYYSTCYLCLTNKSLYIFLNTIAVIIHFANAIAIGALQGSHFKNIPEGYVFISPIAQLDWTNHALVQFNADTNVCSEVAQSPQFIATIPASPALGMNLFPARRPYKNFMTLFDFTNTSVITYNVPGNEVHLNMMMMCFCLLSALFQLLHMFLLLKYETMPRFLHYAEYAISSPLMVMVMAVNVGLTEVFIVTSLGALFYGMNIMGMCAEVMAHYAGHVEREGLFAYLEVCKAVHIAGWVMFLFAMCPIWIQVTQVRKCSENSGTPAYAYTAIVLESFLFFLFGFLQMASLIEKFQFVLTERIGSGTTIMGFFYSQYAGFFGGQLYTKEQEDSRKTGTVEMKGETLFKYDCMHAILSVFAKTLLAWLLLGAALSVDTSLLK
jgi:hypothetical protein